MNQQRSNNPSPDELICVTNLDAAVWELLNIHQDDESHMLDEQPTTQPITGPVFLTV